MNNSYFSDKELHIFDATDEEKANMIHLRDSILNPLRIALGKIICTSGHRNEKHNAVVGGAKLSHHLCKDGYAAVDIKAEKVGLENLFYFIKKTFDYAELILEWDQNVVHVSCNADAKKNTKRTSIRKIIDGKRTYLPS